jgi:hypothetical protein
MPPSVKFKSNIILATPRYASQRGVDSVLCHIAESHDSALCRIVGSHDSALCGMARSCDSKSYIRKYLYEFATICKNILTRWSVTQVGLIHEKTRGLKISWDCPFLRWMITCLQNLCPTSSQWRSACKCQPPAIHQESPTVCTKWKLVIIKGIVSWDFDGIFYDFIV